MFVFDEWNERNAYADVRIITVEDNLAQSHCSTFVTSRARLCGIGRLILSLLLDVLSFHK